MRVGYTSMTSRRRFERLAAEALDELPAWVRERMANVEVVVEDLPPDDDPDLLGLYEGIPLTERFDYSLALPDRISLYRSSIEDEAGDDPDELRRVIGETVTHEIAHHFGISDERLHEMGRD
jgi:predicted Zn-dependent protease with MMP-like domain